MNKHESSVAAEGRCCTLVQLSVCALNFSHLCYSSRDSFPSLLLLWQLAFSQEMLLPYLCSEINTTTLCWLHIILPHSVSLSLIDKNRCIINSRHYACVIKPREWKKLLKRIHLTGLSSWCRLSSNQCVIYVMCSQNDSWLCCVRHRGFSCIECVMMDV